MGSFFVCGFIVNDILIVNKYDRRVEIQFNKNQK